MATFDPIPGDRILCDDLYGGDVQMGRVVGTAATDGSNRRGIDVESAIGIDADTLRIQPLVNPGWGRAVLAYGPFKRAPGLALVCFLLNGHNTSQSENLHEAFRYRMLRWLEGSETHSLARRFIQWMRHPRKARMLRRIRCWWRGRGGGRPMPKLDENLAIGFFPDAVPADPVGTSGNHFVMHATGPENGELWLRIAGQPMPAVRGVQNLQIYYIVILRERGAAYYLASLPDAQGMGAYPRMRLVGIDPFDTEQSLYGIIAQSVLGQIGFRLDTRGYGTRIAELVDYAGWCGQAHVADRLVGSTPLAERQPECGTPWQVFGGDARCEENGAVFGGHDVLAMSYGKDCSGLLHCLVTTNASSVSAGLCWRIRDPENYWCFRVGADGVELGLMLSGVWESLAHAGEPALTLVENHALQVSDDGQAVACFLDGRLVFERRFIDTRLADAKGVGIKASDHDGALRFRDFEAHPRETNMPEALQLGEPWMRKGERVVIVDDFEGGPADLEGRRTPLGGAQWHRSMGSGVMDLTGEGAVKIRADVDRPNPGRTAYMVDWDSPEFVDVEVELKPPGKNRGEGHHGLAGLIFWQDDDNYITINIWVKDSYGGASISCFFQLDGFEDLYDAIWTNVGSRVRWGQPLTLRVVMDGSRYLVFIDDEPVLFRALADVYAGCKEMRINRVGLLANWEWGNDTGSEFRAFRVRD